MDKQNKQVDYEKFASVFGQIMREIKILEKGKVVKNFFDEKMMSGCSNLSDFQN